MAKIGECEQVTTDFIALLNEVGALHEPSLLRDRHLMDNWLYDMKDRLKDPEIYEEIPAMTKGWLDKKADTLISIKDIGQRRAIVHKIYDDIVDTMTQQIINCGCD